MGLKWGVGDGQAAPCMGPVHGLVLDLGVGRGLDGEGEEVVGVVFLPDKAVFPSAELGFISNRNWAFK